MKLKSMDSLFKTSPVALLSKSPFGYGVAEHISCKKSNNCNAVRPSILTAASKAITSASDDECEIAPCFLQIHVIGTNVFGPSKHRTEPVLDFESSRYPAKLASAYSASIPSSG